MARVLHLIDSTTRADMLRQLAMLAGETDAVVSVGPAAAGPRWSEPSPPAVAQWHAPLGSARLCGWRIAPMAWDFNVVHAWSERAAAAAAVTARRAGRPAVVSVSCVPGDDRRRRALVGGGRKRGPALVVPTENSRRLLVAEGADASRVHVVPPAAAPIDDAENRRRQARKHLGLAPSQRLLVAPTEMVRFAGHRYASWAHAIVRQTRGNVGLLLPGGGPNEAHVRCFAGTTGYDEEVFFTGDRLSLADVLAAADVAVFFHERDCGVAALAAAMAAGVPVVASATADIAEVAPHGEAALLVRPGAPAAQAGAVLALLERPDLRRRIAGAAARRATRLFGLADCRKRLERVYAMAALH